MKKCFKCGITKSLDEFYKHKQMKNGRLNKCKECTKKDTFNNDKVFSNKTIEAYDKTEKGVIRVIYKTQKVNSKRRKHNPPTYTKDELKIWLYKNNFLKLYNEWVYSGFDKNKKPSIDRIDDFKGYSFDNILLTTWGKNKEKQAKDFLNGTGTSGLRCKPILKFNKNMQLIAEYVSYSSAARDVGYFFEKSLRSHNPDRKNRFIWYYKEDYLKINDNF
jgi:hypothetical protein